MVRFWLHVVYEVKLGLHLWSKVVDIYRIWILFYEFELLVLFELFNGLCQRFLDHVRTLFEVFVVCYCLGVSVGWERFWWFCIERWLIFAKAILPLLKLRQHLTQITLHPLPPFILFRDKLRPLLLSLKPYGSKRLVLLPHRHILFWVTLVLFNRPISVRHNSVIKYRNSRHIDILLLFTRWILPTRRLYFSMYINISRLQRKRQFRKRWNIRNIFWVFRSHMLFLTKLCAVV